MTLEPSSTSELRAQLLRDLGDRVELAEEVDRAAEAMLAAVLKFRRTGESLREQMQQVLRDVYRGRPHADHNASLVCLPWAAGTDPDQQESLQYWTAAMLEALQGDYELMLRDRAERPRPSMADRARASTRRIESHFSHGVQA